MSLRVVILGAVALGPKAAARCKRLLPDSHVTLIDQSDRISYGGCGIPFFVSGEVNRVEELQETTYKTVRDKSFFKTHKDIDALVETQALSINRSAKTVTVCDLPTGATRDIPYDKLVLATGASPNRPPIAGIELEGITPATDLDKAEYIRNTIAAGGVKRVVVVGGGFIGLEMAVAFADLWGIPVSVVEFTPQVMSGFFSKTLFHIAKNDVSKNDVSIYTSEKVLRFEGENGKVARVVTDKRTIEAELVIMAAGVSPNSQLAKVAGLRVTERGLVEVDAQLRTSDPDIYAGGDLVTIPHLITGKPGWFPLGSMANRQGRVIGSNLAGGAETFPGAVGAWGIKLFKLAAAGAGLTLEVALREGFDAISVLISQLDKAHFYPERDLMQLELVVDKTTRQVLGIQGVSPNGDALLARVNAVAAVLAHKVTVADISNLEVVYTPPFAAAMDIVNALANVADNVISGRYRPLDQAEFQKLWENRGSEEVHFLDTRDRKGGAEMAAKYPKEWHNIPQDELYTRLAEVPTDKPIMLICNTGLRSYEAQLNLETKGITNTCSLMGGLTTAKVFGTEL